ncbi:hypothetical protein N7488_012438 [Penicillium malachiteum]|nr:hypothetical protein N7488_012438 [Penicillium malachiteum]
MNHRIKIYSLLLIIWTAAISAQDVAAAAQPPAPTSTGLCASQDVVDKCVATMKHSLEICSDNDWDCKCSGSANIANCYEDCPDDPARFSAELVSEQDCATANAYDKGLSTVTNSWSTPGPETVTATPTDTSATSTGGPTKSVNGLEESASPSEGAAAIKSVVSWLAFVGLGFGMMV